MEHQQHEKQAWSFFLRIYGLKAHSRSHELSEWVLFDAINNDANEVRFAPGDASTKERDRKPSMECTQLLSLWHRFIAYMIYL